MLVSAIKRRVKRQFGDESGAQLKDTDIIDWINDAQRELYTKNNLGEKVGVLATIVGTQAYAFPTDLMRLFNVKYNGISVSELNQQDIDKFVPNADAVAANLARGSAIYYWTYGDKILLYPVPDVVVNLTIRYNRFPTDVAVDTDNTDCPLIYDNRILDYCHASAAQMDGNIAGYNLFMQRFEGKTNSTKDDEFEMQQSASYSSMSVSLRDVDEGGVV